MKQPRTLQDLTTPAAIVDIDRMTDNLDRMAAYVAEHGIAHRPHIKTHKTPELAREQLRRGCPGLTVATLREAEVMAGVADDLLLAYPPVGPAKLGRLLDLPESVRTTVALDSNDVLAPLSAAAAAAGRTVGVLVELDLGMRRVGIADTAAAVELAERAGDAPGIEFRGVLFYPGHIRQPVTEQDEALARLSDDLRARLDALRAHGIGANTVSGGSTPTAFGSHRVNGLTEIRPGTYIFNDRSTAAIGACQWTDCAYSILATVVSTAVPGQAVVDAGSKAINREYLRGSDGDGFGALVDHPDVVVRAMSEEHGILELGRSTWRPRVGDRVQIVPNHVCISVNLHTGLWGVRDARIEAYWKVVARGWSE
ncbi:MAG: alanine racemase [Gemmatimonadota bacterium]|jgi:D-serine deaminase-like pyridoxal phosphate-dependent protein